MEMRMRVPTPIWRSKGIIISFIQLSGFLVCKYIRLSFPPLSTHVPTNNNQIIIMVTITATIININGSPSPHDPKCGIFPLSHLLIRCRDAGIKGLRAGLVASWVPFCFWIISALWVEWGGVFIAVEFYWQSTLVYFSPPFSLSSFGSLFLSLVSFLFLLLKWFGLACKFWIVLFVIFLRRVFLPCCWFLTFEILLAYYVVK